MRNYSALRTFLLTAFFSWCLATSAQTTNVMKITTSGGTVAGDSTVTGHAGEIFITSFSWGVTVPYSGGGAGVPQFSEIVIIKPVDKASPTMARYCALGTAITDAAFTATRLNSLNQTVYDAYAIKVHLMRITSIKTVEPPVGAVGPYESITFAPAPNSNFNWEVRNTSGQAFTSSYP
jgi:type VI secretion system Hcp family effector